MCDHTWALVMAMEWYTCLKCGAFFTQEAYRSMRYDGPFTMLAPESITTLHQLHSELKFRYAMT